MTDLDYQPDPAWGYSVLAEETNLDFRLVMAYVACVQACLILTDNPQYDFRFAG